MSSAQQQVYWDIQREIESIKLKYKNRYGFELLEKETMKKLPMISEKNIKGIIFTEEDYEYLLSLIK
jgi:hypothetical protein